jgi:hypothetical protein
MIKIANEQDLPAGAQIEGRYGDKIVVLEPDILPATYPGSVEHTIKPRFFDREILVRRVYVVLGGRS